MDTDSSDEMIELVADIVAAYVAHNRVPAADLPGLIEAIYGSIASLGKEALPEPVEEKHVPAVPVRKSITPDHLICLEDGKKFRSLKRHLRTVYDMSPEEYRAKWKLPADYPMVAPAYAEMRSQLARASGLGQVREKFAGRGKKA